VRVPSVVSVQVADLLVELYDRIGPLIVEAVSGLSVDDLRWSPGPGSNSIGWLVWHAARVQDCQVAPLRGEGQVWTTGDFAARFGLDPDPTNSGYGHTAAEVEAVRPEGAAALVENFDAVAAVTRSFLATLSPPDLDRVVDRRWDPPVTMGARLVSVAEDDLQHVGQAMYLRGMRQR
jgi:hypothetical protein